MMSPLWYHPPPRLNSHSTPCRISILQIGGLSFLRPRVVINIGQVSIKLRWLNFFLLMKLFSPLLSTKISHNKPSCKCLWKYSVISEIYEVQCECLFCILKRNGPYKHTTQHNTTQHNTTQHNTTQHNN